MLAAPQEIKEVPALNADSLALIASLEDEFCEEDAQEVKDIEAVTNHDVKAVEYFLRSKVRGAPTPTASCALQHRCSGAVQRETGGV